MHNPLGGTVVGCVEDLSQQQWLEGLPDHPRHGVGIQVLDQAVAVGSCTHTHTDIVSSNPGLWLCTPDPDLLLLLLTADLDPRTKLGLTGGIVVK